MPAHCQSPCETVVDPCCGSEEVIETVSVVEETTHAAEGPVATDVKPADKKPMPSVVQPATPAT
jgi:hypothetical protein